MRRHGHTDCINNGGAHQMMGALVDSNIRSQGAYSANDRRLPTEPDTGTYLIVISLLSLGLWATIRGTVTLLFSVL
jgi:hypothetical protein